MRYLILLLLLTTAAYAGPLDAKATAKRVEGCAGADTVGAIRSAEAIGKRDPAAIVQVTGAKARGYVVFEADGCYVVPVVGKPMAFAKGDFGGGATLAYVLRGACHEACTTVVSLKTRDDKLLDVLALPMDCEDSATLTRRALFAGRDSLELGCWTSGGADQSRSDFLLDAGDGALRAVLRSASGTAWVQIDDDRPACTARVPGGLRIVATGAKPAVEVTTMSTPEDAEAAKVEWHSGGCEATVATRRFEYDGSAFVPRGKPRISVATKLCRCR